MKSLILAAAVALAASPALAGGQFEDAAVAYLTAREICPGYRLDVDRADIFTRLAASEMGMGSKAADIHLGIRVLIAKDQIERYGSRETFCRDMKPLAAK